MSLLSPAASEDCKLQELVREYQRMVARVGHPTCFYCDSTTHVMAVPQKMSDWQPGPLCSKSQDLC